MIIYFGILDKGDDVWGVTLPDLDGCVGAGATSGDAISSAIDSLRIVAEHRLRNGIPLPPPTAAERLAAQEAVDASKGEAIVAIPLLLDAGRTVKANITLDAGLLESIDAEAKLRGLTRSAFLASAAREKIMARR